MRFLWYPGRGKGYQPKPKITLTETLIILDILKTESNNCFIIHWTNAKTWKSCSCFFTDDKQHESREVDMITLGNHALRVIHDMITGDLDMITRDLDMIIV